MVTAEAIVRTAFIFALCTPDKLCAILAGTGDRTTMTTRPMIELQGYRSGRVRELIVATNLQPRMLYRNHMLKKI